MRRAFVSNILLLLLVNVLIKPFFIFGIDLTVQNRAEPGAYGLYFALLNWTYLFQIISDFGLQNYNTRHVSHHPHLLEKYFPNIFLIKLLLGIVFMGVALAVAVAVGGYHKDALWLLTILLLNQALVQMILFLRSNIAGLGYYRTDSFLSSLDKLLMLLFCGAALWMIPEGHFPVEIFALAQTAALVVTVVIVGFILKRHSPLSLTLRLLFNMKRGWLVVRLIFKKSLPFALVILLMSAYSRLDSILLERILDDGAYHTDVFAGGYRLLDALNMFGYLFASLLLPMFSRQLAGGEDVRPLAALSFKWIWVGSWTACVAIFTYREEIAALMFDGKTDLAYRARVSGILIWNFLAVCTIYIFSTLLTAGGRTAAMNRFFVAGLVLDIVLNWLLIPSYKAEGAAIASLSTQTFVALGMVVLSIFYYQTKPAWAGAVRWALFTILLGAAAWGMYHWWAAAWWMRWAATIVSGGFLGLVTGNIIDRNGINRLRARLTL